MSSEELRRRFLAFFEKRGHAILPSSPLVPENDPTTLFTTAGMQPLVPFLLGEKHPAGTRLASVQKCLRTGDIDEVGDTAHLTFFEMLGNWSLGDYFKKEAIEWSFLFLTDRKEGLGLDPRKLYVTIFAGDADAPKDLESLRLWQKTFSEAGIDASEGEVENGPSSGRIFSYGKEKNWWGPVGETGPCGPDTEMFYDTEKEHDRAFGPSCHPNCDCGRFVEIWNDVFMEYARHEDGSFRPLAQKNVDTGMGLERVAMVLQNVRSVFETDLFTPIIEAVLRQVPAANTAQPKALRIIADHVRAAVFLLADGVLPSNLDRGYVARRLIRRAIRYGKTLGIEHAFCASVAEPVLAGYRAMYSELGIHKKEILRELAAEEERFKKTLDRGMRELDRMAKTAATLSGADAFLLYDTFGFPTELTLEIAEQRALKISERFEDEFSQKMEEQKARSRTATAGTFKGGLADHSQIVTWYHTATHLTYAALRKVLGSHVHQRGSNITAERLRFDFSHPEKLTDEQKQKVEEFVNEAIAKNLTVSFEELPTEEAQKRGAVGEFGHKYGPTVKVYTMKEPVTGTVWSYEICGGPHVAATGEIKGTYRIMKEESVAAGIRRIKAVIH